MGCGWGRQLVEGVENAAIRIREEVSVEIERDADRRVTHLRLQVLRVRAGRDHQRRVGVAKVVEAEAGQLRAANGRAEDAVAEVVVVQDLALQDAIALWLEVGLLDAGEGDPHIDRDDVSVELHVKLPPQVRRAADIARRRRERARGAEAEAAAATREAARALVESGLSRRDAAEVLELSHQRVDQLLRSA
jgi:hypothetical protein